MERCLTTSRFSQGERLRQRAYASGSPLKVSEGTHSSLVSADHHLTSFYTEVFGLIPSEINSKLSGYQNPSTRQTLILEEGQEFYLSVFSSPKDIAGVLQIYTPVYPTPDQREYSQPGSLGLSLFTYRVEDIADFHQRVSNSSATHVTPIVSNEFGEPSFGLLALLWFLLGDCWLESHCERCSALDNTLAGFVYI